MFLYRLVHKMFIVDDLYKIWKQSKSSLTDEGKTNHELSMYNEILVSNEKEKNLIDATIWMNLKIIMLSERN